MTYDNVRNSYGDCVKESDSRAPILTHRRRLLANSGLTAQLLLNMVLEPPPFGSFIPANTPSIGLAEQMRNERARGHQEVMRPQVQQ